MTGNRYALKSRLSGLIGAVCLLAGVGCHEEGDGTLRLSPRLQAALTEQCPGGSGKREVLALMEEWYFWNDRAGQRDKYRRLDPGRYADVSDLLDFLRYRPDRFDRGFSYITTPEAEQRFFSEGRFVGFGLGLVQARVADPDNPYRLIISQVYAGGPADRAGLARGFRVRAIDGVPVAALVESGTVEEALGPPEEGLSVRLSVEDRSGSAIPSVRLSKEVVTIEPVPVASVLAGTGGDTVGYLLLRTFIDAATGRLRDAFADFQQQGVDSVIVDLRVNGGGRVDVAETMGSLLAGPGNASNIFFTQRFNSRKAAAYNRTATFDSEASALTLNHLIFITGRSTASASELVINGLAPYFQGSSKQLALVGGTTFGKPVGQSAFDFCAGSQRLRAVTFETVNVNDNGGYYEGLPVDCAVADDFNAKFGEPNETLLATAVDYLQTGTCSVSSMRRQAVPGTAVPLKPEPLAGRGGPWQRYSGSF